MFEEALLSIGLLVVVAKLVEGVLQRFGLSSIFAFTLTGILLGPVAGIVHPVNELALFLGVGIFVLFFLIGLDEIDISGFVATIRGRFFVAAIISVVVSLLAALAVTSDIFYDFGLELEFSKSVALAGILSLSSLGLVARVLADSGHLKQPIGIQIFTTVIIAEMVALLLIGFTIGEHAHAPSAAGVLVLLGQVAGFAVVAWVLSAKLIPPVMVFLLQRIRVPELSFGLLLGGLFLMVVAAEEIGLHGSLGALLFGAALSGLPNQVRREIIPGLRSMADGLFVPLFFASAGLQLGLSFIELPLWTIVALVAVPLVGKFAGAFIGAYVTRLDMPFSLATGLMAKGVAEIALLLVLFQSGHISQEVFSLLILVMFGYILLMPLAIKFAVDRAGATAGATDRPRLPASTPPSLARYALENVTVRDMLDRSRSYPQSDVSVRIFNEEWANLNQQHYVVVDEGAVSGIVSLTRLRFLPESAWDSTPLRNVLRMHTPEAWPEERIDDVLERMTDHSLTVIPVMDPDSGHFLGAVTSRDILDQIMMESD